MPPQRHPHHDLCTPCGYLTAPTTSSSTRSSPAGRAALCRHQEAGAGSHPVREACGGQFFVTKPLAFGGTLTNPHRQGLDRPPGAAWRRWLRDGPRAPGQKKCSCAWERDKLEKALGGIKDDRPAGGALRHRRQERAHSDPRSLASWRFLVIAVADTNCDPDVLDYVIPVTTTRSAPSLFTAKIADACVVGSRLVGERAASHRGGDDDPYQSRPWPLAGHAHAHSERVHAGGGRRRSQVELAWRRGGLRSVLAAAATRTGHRGPRPRRRRAVMIAGAAAKPARQQ